MSGLWSDQGRARRRDNKAKQREQRRRTRRRGNAKAGTRLLRGLRQWW